MLIRNDLEVDNKITADNIRCIELLSGVNVCMTGQTQSFSFKATNRVNSPIVNASTLNVSQININSITLNTFNVSQLNASSIDGDLIVADEMVVLELEAVTGAIDELTTIDLFTDVLYVREVNASNLSCFNVSLAELEAGEILCDGRITTVNMSATTISSTTLQSNQIFTPLVNVSTINASNLFVKFGSEFDGAMIIRNDLEVDNALTAGDIISNGVISGSNISMTGQVTSSVLKANNRVNAPTMNASVLNGSSLNVTGSVTLQGQVNADAVSITELLEAGDIVSNGNSSLTNISASTIHSTNISGVNGSFTNMTVNDLYVNNLFNSTKNYGFLSRDGTQGLGADTVAYPLYDFTGLFNTALYTNVDNTQMRVLKAGYYRINAEAAFDNVTLSDRLTMRQRILINGSFSIVNGYGLCYIRTNNFGNFGSVSLSTIVLLSVNDLIRQEYSVNVGNSQGFNSNFNNYITAVSQQLMVEFLG
jgi:cytoskeletal protein CcmA (bactofilin family)